MNQTPHVSEPRSTGPLRVAVGAFVAALVLVLFTCIRNGSHVNMLPTNLLEGSDAALRPLVGLAVVSLGVQTAAGYRAWTRMRAALEGNARRISAFLLTATGALGFVAGSLLVLACFVFYMLLWASSGFLMGN